MTASEYLSYAFGHKIPYLQLVISRWLACVAQSADVHTPAEDARPLAILATPKVQTERHKEDRTDIFVVSRSRSMDLNCKMVRNGEVVAVHQPNSTTQS